MSVRRPGDFRRAVISWSRSSSARTVLTHSLAVLITVYGAMLRLDAWVGKYGTLDHPTWARLATQDLAPLARGLAPSGLHWNRVETPFVGGDPMNYLRFAREMRGFYQAHVREPVFLVLTRAGLWAVEGQDAGLSLASLAGSVITIPATYLLGAALLSPVAGLIAALLIAIDYDAIAWAPDGWRDDTFTALVVLAAWALLRLRSRPSYFNAALAGTIWGLVCLTRVTALSFMIPGALAMVMGRAESSRKTRARFTAIALLVTTAVFGPYLVSCAIVTGDPFIAINHHTAYYRSAAAGRPMTDPMSTAEYLGNRFADRPLATIDTGFLGLFVHPFTNKWKGFDRWHPGLGALLEWIAGAGLAGLLFFPTGRLLIVVLQTSLLPYIFTWNLGGGGEWRFTMHTYPFYLVGAAVAGLGVLAFARVVIRTPNALRRETAVPLAWRVAGVLMLAGVGTALYYVLPWFVVREAIAKGDSTSVETGSRDLVFYRHGWSRPHKEGITVRVSLTAWAVVRIPLPEQRDYDLVLRIDPVRPDVQERVTVLFNRRVVGALRLSWNPERVGSYRVHIPEHVVRVGSNQATVVTHTLVPASSAGPRFAWVNPAERLGVRLWYVRVLPVQEQPGARQTSSAAPAPREQ